MTWHDIVYKKDEAVDWLYRAVLRLALSIGRSERGRAGARALGWELWLDETIKNCEEELKNEDVLYWFWSPKWF